MIGSAEAVDVSLAPVTNFPDRNRAYATFVRRSNREICRRSIAPFADPEP
ncbi:hypothetical protein [Microbaculum sp. FT89]